MRGGVAVGAVLACLVATRTGAAAAPCVTTTVQPAVLDEKGRARLVEQLAASLGQHEIATCSGGQAPIAEVVFELPGAGAGVAIRVRDAVTGKEVTRVARTGAIPKDGRALALAVAADELLRASWAEILLARAPAPPPEPPPQVRALVEVSLAPRPAFAVESPPAEAPSPLLVRPEGRRFFLGAALAGEHATGGLTLGGVDARLGVFALERVSFGVRLGARAAPPSTASDGSATASALVVGAGGAIALLPRGRAFGLDLPVRVDVEEVQFVAHPSPGARGSDGSAVGVSASGGLVASVRFAAAWRVALEATVGAVVRPIEAQDGVQALTALSGAVVGGAFGVTGEI